MKLWEAMLAIEEGKKVTHEYSEDMYHDNIQDFIKDVNDNGLYDDWILFEDPFDNGLYDDWILFEEPFKKEN